MTATAATMLRKLYEKRSERASERRGCLVIAETQLRRSGSLLCACARARSAKCILCASAGTDPERGPRRCAWNTGAPGNSRWCWPTPLSQIPRVRSGEKNRERKKEREGDESRLETPCPNLVHCCIIRRLLTNGARCRQKSRVSSGRRGFRDDNFEKISRAESCRSRVYRYVSGLSSLPLKKRVRYLLRAILSGEMNNRPR